MDHVLDVMLGSPNDETGNIDSYDYHLFFNEKI